MIVNIKDKTLDRISFAKALAYSIDRNLIFDYLYSSDEDNIKGGPGVYGIIPPDFLNREYEVKSIEGYKLDLDSAKYYLKKSRFSSYKGKLRITSRSWGPLSITPQNLIQKNWYDLGIKPVELYIEPYPGLLKNVTTGKEGIYLIPIQIKSSESPEDVLEMFYSKRILRDSNDAIYYANPEFDKYYEAAIKSKERKSAIKNLMLAEQILINDGFVIPLWYGEVVE